MDKPSHFARFRIASVAAFPALCDLKEREKKRLLAEILEIRGLMPLLMKPRNKQLWTSDELEELRIHLRRLSVIRPYLTVFTLPGSSLILPALAWCLDRRRNRQHLPASLLQSTLTMRNK